MFLVVANVAHQVHVPVLRLPYIRVQFLVPFVKDVNRLLILLTHLDLLSLVSFADGIRVLHLLVQRVLELVCSALDWVVFA